MDSPSHQAHEALCQRCGISCRAAVSVEGRKIVIEGLQCPFLQFEEGGKAACAVYDDRFARAKVQCLQAVQAAPFGGLRQGCPYSKGAPGKHALPEDEYEALWPKISAALLSQASVNPHFTWDKFFQRAEDRDPGYHWFLELNPSGTSGRVRRRKKRFPDRLLALFRRDP